jgi:hypothetical protein
MKPSDINFLRRQAEMCVALSRATFDLTVAGQLRSMAEELRAKAAHWENENHRIPAHMMGRSSDANGKRDRG